MESRSRLLTIFSASVAVFLIASTLAFFLFFLSTETTSADTVFLHDVEPDIVLLKVRREVTRSIDTDRGTIRLPSLHALAQRHALQNIELLFPNPNHRHDDLGSIYRLRFPPSRRLEDILEDFRNNPIVEYAEPDPIARASLTPNDPRFNSTDQWNFFKINVEKAWDLDTTPPLNGGDPSVVVAVLDTGIAYENSGSFSQASDFAQTTFVNGHDFINNDTHPNDDNGHGTHVTGTIAQSTNNNLGVAGIAFNASIMPIKVLDAQGSGTMSQIAQGVIFAKDNGADVINMSLGGAEGSQTLQTAIQNAKNVGIVLVAATGNDGASSPQFPAAYNEVIAVGATGANDEIASYSNTGIGIDLVAPGGNGSRFIIQQTFSNLDSNNLPRDFTTFAFMGYQGTSMATPHVAGSAALLLAYGVPSGNVQTLLESSAQDLGSSGYDTTFGFGRIDLHAAFLKVTQDATPPITPTITGYDSSAKKTMLQNGGRHNFPQPYFEWSGAQDTQSGMRDYFVVFGTDPNADPQTQGQATTATNFTAPDLSGLDETTYYLRIKARDTAGNVSGAVQVTYVIDTQVRTPSGLTAASSNKGIKIFWNSSSDPHVVSYNIWRSSRSGKTAAKLNSSSVSKTTYLDSTATLGRSFFYTVTAVDDLGNESVKSKEIQGTYLKPAEVIVGTGPGGNPEVKIFDAKGSLLSSFFAYPSSFRGGINVAVGDLDGDGKDEVVTGAGNGGEPKVRIFDRSGKPRFTNGFFAYAPNVKNGVFVATGDLNGDGKAEIITGTGPGSGPHVRIFDRRGKPVFSPGFFVYGSNVRNGVLVAAGDLDGNGKDEIITGTGQGSGAHVRIFNRTGKPTFSPGFFPYPSNFRGGVRVAAGDLDGNKKDEIVTAPGPGTTPQIRVFDRFGKSKITNGFTGFGQNFRGGVFVAIGDTNQDEKDEIIIGSGTGQSPEVKIVSSNGTKTLKKITPFAPPFQNGLTVASGITK